jgi:hypothetical protein
MLREDAAESYERVVALALDAGLKIATKGVDDAYRPLARQVNLLHDNYTTAPTFSTSGYTVANGGIRTYGGKTWYRRPGKATTAEPGKSNHGLGIAVDYKNLGNFDTAAYRWMATVAAQHGWSNTEGRKINEYWHWTYDPSADKHKGETVALTDADVAKVAQATVTQILNYTNPNVSGGKDNVYAILRGSASRIVALQSQVAALQAALDALAAAKPGTTVNVDADAVAAALLPKIDAQMKAALRSITYQAK